jgi:glycosyltransferase involved in cell wall biosynthesis
MTSAKPQTSLSSDSDARALVVLPTYDEAENVLLLSAEVLEQDPRLDVLVIDDASPDGTGDLVENQMKREPRLSLLRRPGKLGLGTAYLAGFRYALDSDYAMVITMDCDFSHPPRYLPGILEASQHYDLVIGSRYVPGGGIANWPLHRRALSAWANFYTRTLLRLPVRDCTAGFRCYRREVLEKVDPFAVEVSGYSFLEELVWRIHHAGFEIGEYPIIFEDRLRGASKINRSEIFRAALHVLATSLRTPPAPGPKRGV